MGNGLNAVRFIYGRPNVSSADIDCYSVAHKIYYT